MDKSEAEYSKWDPPERAFAFGAGRGGAGHCGAGQDWRSPKQTFLHIVVKHSV